jgi:hypothetical protein
MDFGIIGGPGTIPQIGEYSTCVIPTAVPFTMTVATHYSKPNSVVPFP